MSFYLGCKVYSLTLGTVSINNITEPPSKNSGFCRWFPLRGETDDKSGNFDAILFTSRKFTNPSFLQAQEEPNNRRQFLCLQPQPSFSQLVQALYIASFSLHFSVLPLSCPVSYYFTHLYPKQYLVKPSTHIF